MKKTLAPAGARLSLTALIEDGQDNARINTERKFKTWIKSLGVICDEEGGVVQSTDLQVTDNGDGRVNIAPGRAIIGSLAFPDSTDAELVYMGLGTNELVTVANDSTSYDVVLVYSGINSGFASLINGFLYGEDTLTAPSATDDSLYIDVLLTSANNHALTSGLTLASVSRTDTTITVTDKRQDNVFYLSHQILDDTEIVKTDRDSTITGNLDIVGGLTATSTVDFSGNTTTDALNVEGLLTAENGLKVEEGVAVTFDDIGTNISLSGILNLIFRIGVGTTGPLENPTGGLRVVTEDPAGARTPVNLELTTGLGSRRYFDSRIKVATGLEGTSAYILANIGDQGTGGRAQPANSTTYRVVPTPNWTTNSWAGQVLYVQNGAGATIETVVASNTSNELTVGTAIPAGYNQWWVGPDAYAYDWAILPILDGEEGEPDPLFEDGSRTFHADSPTAMYKIWNNLPIGNTYGIKVRSVSRLGDASDWFGDSATSHGYKVIVAGDTPKPTMTVVTAHAIDGGIRLVWPTAFIEDTGEKAYMYEIVWTDDLSYPDFENDQHTKELTTDTNFTISNAKQGARLKAAVRALNRGLQPSANQSYIEIDIPGAPETLNNKFITGTFDFDTTDTTQVLRIVTEFTTHSAILIDNLQVHLRTNEGVSPANFAKLRVYREGDPTGGISILVENGGTGYSTQSGTLVVPAASNVIIDGWDESEASKSTVFKGSVQARYSESGAAPFFWTGEKSPPQNPLL